MAAVETKFRRKQIDINPDYIKPLTIEGIQKGFSDLKNYIEDLVEKQAEKAIKSQSKKK